MVGGLNEQNNCNIGTAQGEDAFHVMAAWRKGEFRFEPGAVDSNRHAAITTDTLALIMESMTKLDEAGF